MKMKNVLKLVRHYTLICSFTLLFGVEFFFSQMTGSLVLLLDSYHKLFTVLSLVLLVISYKLSDSQTLKNTFGWARMEILGSLFNTIFFASLCFSILVECIQTMAHAGHEDVVPKHPIIIVLMGTAGVFLHVILHFAIGDLMRKEGGYLSITGNDVMVNCVLNNDKKDHPHDPISGLCEAGPSSGAEMIPLVKRKRISCSTSRREAWDDADDIEVHKIASHHPMEEISKDSTSLINAIKGCEGISTPVSRKFRFRNILSNFCTSLLVILSGLLLISLKEHHIVNVADAILALFAVLILGSTIYPSMKESGLILLQTIPKHIDVETLKSSLLNEFPCILSIHDLHIWCLTSTQVIATCHISLPPHSDLSYNRLSNSLGNFFAREGITLATIQPEFTTLNEESSDVTGTEVVAKSCLYQCSKSSSEADIDCATLKCCQEDDDCEAICKGVEKINKSKRYTLSRLSTPGCIAAECNNEDKDGHVA